MDLIRIAVTVLFGAAITAAGGVKLFAPELLADQMEVLWENVWADKLPFLGTAANMELVIGICEFSAGILVLLGPIALRRVMALLLAAGPLLLAVYSHLTVNDNKWQPAAVLAGLGFLVSVWPVASEAKAKPE